MFWSRRRGIPGSPGQQKFVVIQWPSQIENPLPAASFAWGPHLSAGGLGVVVVVLVVAVGNNVVAVVLVFEVGENVVVIDIPFPEPAGDLGTVTVNGSKTSTALLCARATSRVVCAATQRLQIKATNVPRIYISIMKYSVDYVLMV